MRPPRLWNLAELRGGAAILLLCGWSLRKAAPARLPGALKAHLVPWAAIAPQHAPRFSRCAKSTFSTGSRRPTSSVVQSKARYGLPYGPRTSGHQITLKDKAFLTWLAERVGLSGVAANP